ncbi:MAG: nucleotidyltransferase domain-containing protein [Cyanobacteria bacterium P01_D01_bin.1]
MHITPVFHQLQAYGRIAFSSEALSSFCEKWKVAQLCIFGSVLRDDFHPDKSDLDFLVTFSPNDPWNLLDLVTMEQELATLAGARIDLIEKRGVENSRNPIRKAEILRSAQIIYSQSSRYELA